MNEEIRLKKKSLNIEKKRCINKKKRAFDNFFKHIKS